MKCLKIIILSSLLFCLKSYSSQVDPICYTSSSHVKMFASAYRSDFLERPFNIAFKHRKIKNVYGFVANSDDDLRTKAETAFNNGCKVIVGLFTSKECLITAPIAKKYGAIIISPTCGHTDIANWNGYVYSMVPSIDDYAKYISEVLNKNYGKDKWLIAYQPSDPFSLNSYQTLKSRFSTNLLSVRVSKEGDIYSEDLPVFYEKNLSVIVVLTYPVVGAKVSKNISDKIDLKNKLTLISGSSWAFDSTVLKVNASSFVRYDAVFVPEVVDTNVYSKSTFLVDYKNEYKEDPFVIHALSYDGFMLAQECLPKSSKKFDINKYRLCLTSKQFKGITGNYMFSNLVPFSKRVVFLNNIKSTLR